VERAQASETPASIAIKHRLAEDEQQAILSGYRRNSYEKFHRNFSD
jgi:hypothetical protein